MTAREGVGDPQSGTAHRLPVEDRSARAGWVARVLRTLLAIVAAPMRSFWVCPEPVDHGRVLRFLATLRFVPWVVLVGALLIRQATTPVNAPTLVRPIHTWVEPALAEVLSAWTLIMVPMGMPLLYFATGVLAHIGMGLTGGAPRSLGASLRAVGYALGPALLAVSLLDLPLYLGVLSGWVFFPILAVVSLWAWVLAAIALAQTHRVALVRGVLVSLLPLVIFAGVSASRAMLELSEIPFVETPGGREVFVPSKL